MCVKPLIYSQRNGQIGFASTVRALHAAGFGGGIEPDAIIDLLEFGWVKFRSSDGSAVHCRLGGDFGGSGNGSPSEDNPATIAMFLGKSAPQPPTSAFGPGCVTGPTLQ